MTEPTELSLDGAKDARAIKRLAGLHIFTTSYLISLIACLPMSSNVVQRLGSTNVDCSSVRFLVSHRKMGLVSK